MNSIGDGDGVGTRGIDLKTPRKSAHGSVWQYAAESVPSPKRRWTFLGVAGFGSFLALALVFRRVPFEVLLTQFRTLDWGWYLVAHGCFALALLGSALRWHALLKLDGLAGDWRVAVRLTWSGHFFGTALVGVSSGDVIKTALYSRMTGYPASRVAAACVLDRLTAGVGGALVFVFSMVLAWHHGALGLFANIDWQWRAFWVVGGILGLGAVGFWAGRRFRRQIGSGFLGRTQDSLGRSIRVLKATPWLLCRVLGLSLVSAALLILAQLCCLQGLSAAPIPWQNLLWVVHLVTVVASLPVSLAGAGLREAAALVLLGWYGISEAESVGAALLTLSIHAFWASWGLFWALRLWRRGRWPVDGWVT